MENRRFEGEKNLADKLAGFESGFDAKDVQDFESMLESSSVKFSFWSFFVSKGIFFLAGLILSLVILNFSKKMVPEEKNHSIYSDQSEEYSNTTVNQSTKELSTVNPKSDVKDEKLSENSNFGNHSPNRTSKTYQHQYSNQERRNPRLTLEDNIKTENTSSTIETLQGSNAPTSINATEESNTAVKMGDSQMVNTEVSGIERFLDIDLLPYPGLDLETSPSIIDDLFVVTEPVSLPAAPLKKVSFGIQYHVGRVLPSAHMTPSISNFETFIEGESAFGYGLFGQFNLNKRHAIRTSFTYNKYGHRQIVDGLRFSSGPTSLILELYAYELKFGLDYAFNLLPNTGAFDLKIGGGVAYHSVVNTISDNYYSSLELEVQNSNELTISPLSYKVFLALEVPIYGGTRLGVEPFFTYQQREVLYTSSTFLADQGNYNQTVGINFTLGF